MKSILKLASLMVLCAGSAMAQQYTEVKYNDTVYLPNCGGTVNTKCGSDSKCYINISNSKCNVVRLYDVVTLDSKGNKFFQETSSSVRSTLSLSSYWSSTYSTTPYQLWADKSRFHTSYWNAFLYGKDYKHYVTMFISSNDGRPYDRVVLWFKSK